MSVSIRVSSLITPVHCITQTEEPIIWNLCYSAESQTSAEILRPRSCRVESELRSLNSNVSTYIQVINRSSSSVKVYWIDFNGKRQHYFDLDPLQSRDQQTYVTHTWLIAQSGANQPCIHIFLPIPQKGIIIID